MLLRPLIFKSSNSFLLIISKKKNWVAIIKIKGKISKSVDGTLSIDIKIEKKRFTSWFLKNEISSNKFSIKIKKKKTKKIFKIFFKNSIIRWSSNVLIIIIYFFKSLIKLIDIGKKINSGNNIKKKVPNELSELYLNDISETTITIIPEKNKKDL